MIAGALAVLACAVAAPMAIAQQPYPTKPVRVIVAFTAGGTTDLLARSIGTQLADRLGQPFVIENRPGAGGNIGTEIAVRAAPDGYTLIVNSVGPIAVNPTLYRKLGYDPLTDLVPIVQIAEVPNVLVVHPSLPVRVDGRIRRLRESESREAELRLHRHRHVVAPFRLPPVASARASRRSTCRTRAPTR